MNGKIKLKKGDTILVYGSSVAVELEVDTIILVTEDTFLSFIKNLPKDADYRITLQSD